MPQIWKEFCMGTEIHGNYDKCKEIYQGNLGKKLKFVAIIGNIFANIYNTKVPYIKEKKCLDILSIGRKNRSGN